MNEWMCTAPLRILLAVVALLLVCLYVNITNEEPQYVILYYPKGRALATTLASASWEVVQGG